MRKVPPLMVYMCILTKPLFIVIPNELIRQTNVACLRLFKSQQNRWYYSCDLLKPALREFIWNFHEFLIVCIRIVHFIFNLQRLLQFFILCSRLFTARSEPANLIEKKWCWFRSILKRVRMINSESAIKIKREHESASPFNHLSNNLVQYLSTFDSFLQCFRAVLRASNQSR